MVEALGPLALAAVLVMLALSVRQQFHRVERLEIWLERLGIVPQWKFFGQDAVGWVDDDSDDWHVVARCAPIADTDADTDTDDDAATPWRPVIWIEDRRWYHGLWNPHFRSNVRLLILAERLAMAPAERRPPPDALATLAIARACMARLAPRADQALQFAVVLTIGRSDRRLARCFLSDWYVP